MKIVTVVGARPQFIKAAALSKHIKETTGIDEVLVHTGQHFDENMSDIFFRQMELPSPDYRFNINDLSHGAMTGQMLEAVETVLLKEKPDCVLVYGDTNSTLAGALAAKKLNIKLAHVEAGLRSFNLNMPEEINRILTDRISDFLFCPTETAVSNLQKEGFSNFDCKVLNTGDIMLDSLLLFQGYIDKFAQASQKFTSKKFALCTIHRAENTGNDIKLASIIKGLNLISQETEIVVPLHPGTKEKLNRLGLKLNATLIEPVGYFDMLNLLKNCEMVITDSGGLQKEAYLCKKNCITLREETEWTELVKSGCNILVGSDETKIYSAYQTMSKNNFIEDQSFYGNGTCSQQITEVLLGINN